MKTFLSVDGGGTKTSFLLVDESGKQLASAVLGPANYLVNGLDSVIKTLIEGIEEISTKAKIQKESIEAAFIAIAGFKDIPADIEPVTNAIENAIPYIKIILGNDTENALAGSLLGEEGIHLIAGTGSIGLGYDQDENYIRCGGWHHLFGGDEGSGYWLGSHLILHFTRQADGREAKSELYDYLIEHYDLGCAENILDLVISKWEGKREKIATLSKDVAVLAKMQDPVVLSLLHEAGKELGLIAKAIYQQGNYHLPVKISYSGGVFHSMNYLYDGIEEVLKEIPHVLVPPQLEPLPGGVLLAMKATGHLYNDEVINHLKNYKI